MKMRGLMMLALALVLAVVAVILARNWMRSRDVPVVAQVQTAPAATVLVARSRLDFAARIGPEHVQAVKWPADAVPPGTFKALDELFVPGTERVALRAIEAGEPIFAAKVSGKGQRATLSAIIENDMRATTIRVSDITEVAGFIVPGDRVDVLVTRNEGGGGQNGTINDVLLQNIRVLGIDQIASDRHDKPTVARAVTLEVTAVQAQKLTLASSVGTLSLSLRNEANSDPALHPTIRVSDLRGGEMVRPLPPPEAKNMVRAIRGPGDGGFDPLTSIKIVRAMKPSTQSNVAREKADAVAAAHASAAKTVRVGDLRPTATPPLGTLPSPAKKASWSPAAEEKP